MATNMCPCDTTLESRTHVVGECEVYKEERDVLEKGMGKSDVRGMEEFGRLEGSDKTIAILGDRRRPQTAKRDGDRISKQLLCVVYGRRVTSAQMLEVSLFGGRNGAPSRKECVVDGQIAKAINKMSTPPPSPPCLSFMHQSTPPHHS